MIRASVDLLRRPHLTEERRQRYIEAISDTVNRAAKLTAQLLAFARRQTLKPELFDVGENVQMLSEIIRTLTGASIEIVTRVPGGPCLINADAGQFETALINMAVNARDAMGGEGRLTIAVRNVAELPGAAPQPNAPTAMWRCRSRIPAAAFRRTSSGASSSRSSPPRKSARAPGSACRRCSALQSNPAAR